MGIAGVSYKKGLVGGDRDFFLKQKGIPLFGAEYKENDERWNQREDQIETSLWKIPKKCFLKLNHH